MWRINKFYFNIEIIFFLNKTKQKFILNFLNGLVNYLSNSSNGLLPQDHFIKNGHILMNNLK